MKWLRALRTNTPAGHAVRLIRSVEARSGLAAILQPTHDYSTDVEHPDGATFLRRLDLFGSTPDVESYFSSRITERELVLAYAEWVRVGTIRWFDGMMEIDSPPDWHQVDSVSWPSVHYSHILNNPNGDLRTIWELGRSDFLVSLACAFCIDADPRWTAEYVTLLRSFARDNLVREGVHWANGQEVAIRALNIFWALRIFAAELEEADFDFICDLLYWHGRYVYQHLEFATEVLKNNHAIAEAILLSVLALYFRDWPEAHQWGLDGQDALTGTEAQFFVDGGYCQASDNYQRFAIQLLLWAEQFGLDVTSFVPRFEKTLDQWEARVDSDDKLSNFGQNDGAWFGPRTAETTRSFRSVLNTLSFRTRGVRAFEPDQYGSWLYGDRYAQAGASVRSETALSFAESGWEVVGRLPDRAAIRTRVPRENAGHDDFGHVDLVLNGQRVTLDSGSERYIGNGGKREVLMNAEHHCVLTCEGSPLREALGRFSWLNRDFEANVSRTPDRVSISHDAFDSWRHIRAVYFDDGWIVQDDLAPQTLHATAEFSVWWKLPGTLVDRQENGHTTTLFFDTFQLLIEYHGDSAPSVSVEESFIAPTYGVTEAATRVRVRIGARNGFRIRSTFS